jgi:hypothetical protein
VSVLCVPVLPKEELLKFHFKEVTLGYLALIASLYCSILSCVVSCSFSLVIL